MKGKPVASVMVLAAVLLTLVCLSSCGAGTDEVNQTTADTQKLPPGTTEEDITHTTGSGITSLEGAEEEAMRRDSADSENETRASMKSPGATADLAGARFTVVAATRPDSNADVLSSSQREVPGDYLEIELTVEGVGDDIVDLSEYSFRIWNPGIPGDQYEDYYGKNAVYGKYISENMISAVLMDYATLQPSPYKLKIGEIVDGLFLFYDLNPKSTARNAGVTKEGTNLIIHKTSGDDAGDEVEINLSGYED